MGELSYTPGEGYGILSFIGSFKYPQAEDDIIDKYEEICRQGCQKIILDFQQTERLGTHGLRGILEILFGSKEHGQKVKIVRIPPRVGDKDFPLLGVDISNDKYDSMDEALSALGINP